VSDPKTLAKEQATLLEKAQRLADSFLIQQQLISRQELELKSQMLARIEPIVNALASEGDYAYIFETGSPDAPNIVYATPKIDISDAVIEQYKKRFKDKPFEVPSAEQIAKQIEKLAGAAKDLE
jgi:Skp family chaperone for outer membrane proteins